MDDNNGYLKFELVVDGELVQTIRSNDNNSSNILILVVQVKVNYSFGFSDLDRNNL